MALTKSDLAQIAALVAAMQAQGSPRKGRASSKRKQPGEVTFYTRAQIAAGEGFPCIADGGCGRRLGTKTRASIHGVDEGGHNPAAGFEAPAEAE